MIKISKLGKGQQPEALANLSAAANNDGLKPADQGLTARPDTMPVPTDPALKDDAATRVLREGAFGKPQGAKKAVAKLPDRTEPARKN